MEIISSSSVIFKTWILKITHTELGSIYGWENRGLAPESVLSSGMPDTQTCFIVVGREFVQHLAVHTQNALLQDGGVRQRALSFLPFEGLQLLLQDLRQVGLHIVSCGLKLGGKTREGLACRCGGRTTSPTFGMDKKHLIISITRTYFPLVHKG